MKKNRLGVDLDNQGNSWDNPVAAVAKSGSAGKMG